jgi:hypothetical protein
MGGHRARQEKFQSSVISAKPQRPWPFENHVHQGHFLFDPEDPTLDPGNRPFSWIKFRFEEFR